MNYTWGDNKLTLNLINHKVHFAMVDEFEWDTAQIELDQRKDYGEPRFKAYGVIRERLYCLIFVPRNGDIRVISLRKANKREVKKYAASN